MLFPFLILVGELFLLAFFVVSLQQHAYWMRERKKLDSFFARSRYSFFSLSVSSPSRHVPSHSCFRPQAPLTFLYPFFRPTHLTLILSLLCSYFHVCHCPIVVVATIRWENLMLGWIQISLISLLVDHVEKVGKYVTNYI